MSRLLEVQTDEVDGVISIENFDGRTVSDMKVAVNNFLSSQGYDQISFERKTIVNVESLDSYSNDSEILASGDLTIKMYPKETKAGC